MFDMLIYGDQHESTLQKIRLYDFATCIINPFLSFLTHLIYHFDMSQTKKSLIVFRIKPLKRVYYTLQIQQPFSRLLGYHKWFFRLLTFENFVQYSLYRKFSKARKMNYCLSCFHMLDFCLRSKMKFDIPFYYAVQSNGS